MIAQSSPAGDPAAWTPNQDAIIRANYGKIPNHQIGRALGHSAHQVAGRAKTLGLQAPIVWSDREIALIRTHYAGADSAAIDALVDVIGKERWQITRKARELGLGTPKPPDWTAADEARLIELWGRYPDVVVAKRLHRTVKACLLKAKRLGRNRSTNADGWNLRELGRLMGVDSHKCAWWIERGWLKARTAPYGVGHNPPRIVGEASLLKFLRERPEEHDWRRMGDPSGYYTRIAQEASAELLTTAEVAARYGVRISTVSQWIRKGWLPGVRGHGCGGHGIWYVHARDLVGWGPRRPELVGRRKVRR